MKYAQIKTAEQARGVFTLLSAHPDCEAVFYKCTVTATLAHIDKCAPTGLEVEQRECCPQSGDAHTHTQCRVTYKGSGVMK